MLMLSDEAVLYVLLHRLEIGYMDRAFFIYLFIDVFVYRCLTWREHFTEGETGQTLGKNPHPSSGLSWYTNHSATESSVNRTFCLSLRVNKPSRFSAPTGSPYRPLVIPTFLHTRRVVHAQPVAVLTPTGVLVLRLLHTGLAAAKGKAFCTRSRNIQCERQGKYDVTFITKINWKLYKTNFSLVLFQSDFPRRWKAFKYWNSTMSYPLSWRSREVRNIWEHFFSNF